MFQDRLSRDPVCGQRAAGSGFRTVPLNKSLFVGPWHLALLCHHCSSLRMACMVAISVWRAGNQISSASASVDCQAHIFAQTYAFAAARASAAARCYGKSSDAKARTSVDARVNALVYDNSKCVTKTKKKGLSGNKTKANSRTRSVRPLLS